MPKPTTGESRRHFIARCVIDDEARSDFPDADQRIAFCYSQYENKAETILIKNALDNKYLNAFDKQVDTIEDKNIKELTKYYQKNYNEGIKNYLEYGVTKWESLFTNNSLEKEYQKMYISIGNHIAQWYFRIFKTYISKADSKPYRTEWEKSFANYGGQVAATNVTGVSNTARKTLIKITQQLMRDPEFMILGEREKARILRSKFNHYSKFQAERLVRTESTRAANFAAEKSAKTLFSEDDLSKRWLTIMDGRERPWHQAANGQTVPMSQNFIVGGEEMPRPGEGSARNVINCRCRILPIPVEGAIPVTELDNIGVSLGRNRLEDFSLNGLSNTVEEMIVSVANRQVTEKISQKELMRPDNWDDIVKGAKVNDDYLELLTEKPRLIRTTGRSEQRGLSIKINTERYSEGMIDSILSHEIGHLIHTQRGWITEWSVNPLINDLFIKHRKVFGANLRGAKRVAHQKRFKELFGNGSGPGAWNLDEFNELRKKFPKLSNRQFKEKYMDISDYMGSITKEQIGFGHGKSYYRTKNWQMFEMFAHIMENKYAKNEVFEYLYPKLYKEGIEMLDKLILEYKNIKP